MPVTTRLMAARSWAKIVEDRCTREALLQTERIARGPVSFGGPKPIPAPYVYPSFEGIRRGSLSIENGRKPRETAQGAFKWLNERSPRCDTMHSVDLQLAWAEQNNENSDEQFEEKQEEQQVTIQTEVGPSPDHIKEEPQEAMPIKLERAETPELFAWDGTRNKQEESDDEETEPDLFGWDGRRIKQEPRDLNIAPMSSLDTDVAINMDIDLGIGHIDLDTGILMDTITGLEFEDVPLVMNRYDTPVEESEEHETLGGSDLGGFDIPLAGGRFGEDG